MGKIGRGATALVTGLVIAALVGACSQDPGDAVGGTEGGDQFAVAGKGEAANAGMAN
ncbi:MAG TPA: hypothetical protein VG408_06635 [Actinomycetota bacterium]|nr:hypothetical protein [Actinomycetota bacterium]